MRERFTVRRLSTVFAGLGCGLALAACGEQASPPVLVAVRSYVTDVGEANDTAACALLTPGTQVELQRRAREHRGCARALDHCLPNVALVARKDQSQLLYATIDFTVTGRRASATVAGTAVARIIRRVTLIRSGRRWLLTSAGVGLQCRQARHGGPGAKRHHGPGAKRHV